MENKTRVSYRIKPELIAKLKAACRRDISMTAIIERGIELAIKELKSKHIASHK